MNDRLPRFLLAGALSVASSAAAQPFGPLREFRVNTTTALDQTDPAVATIGGGFIVTWTSLSSTAGLGTAIDAQRFGGPGTALGGEFRVNTYNTGAQAHSSVHFLRNSGEFVVA